MTAFHREDVEAICWIPLSCRQVANSIVWLHSRNGGYSVKSGYHVARQVLKNENWAEGSRGCEVQKVRKALWKLRVPNKIKVFVWRVCHGILPTWVNLLKRKIIGGNVCPIYTQFPETEIHAIWNCVTAQDEWARSLIKLQKCSLSQ